MPPKRTVRRGRARGRPSGRPAEPRKPIHRQPTPSDDLRRTNREVAGEVREFRDQQEGPGGVIGHDSGLFDFAPVTYALLDRDGRILTVNLAGCRLLNARRGGLMGRPLASFVAHEDRGVFLHHLQRCRQGGRVTETAVRFATAGRILTCRVYCRRTKYRNRAAHAMVIVDQSEHVALDEARRTAERRQAQAERASEVAQAANAAKDRFLATVSHELRTPLTPALFAASRLASWNGLPEQARRLAAIVERNIAFEASLIDDLLDVARISRGRISLQFATLDAHAVLREAAGICGAYAEAKDVAVVLEEDAETRHVRGDRVRLRQVFWNLLNNAVKFSDPGGRVIVRSVNAADDVLRVTVRDHGAGMEPSVVERLFAPFDREISLPESRGGLGLGLAICKGIIGAHGGQIWATSEGPGYGSTFAVELATVAAPQTEEAPRTADAAAAADSRPRRVLVIEDDPDSGEMLSMFLRQFGCDVEVVSTLRAGLTRLDHPWDVVLSDIGLPDGSGLEVARRAREMRGHRLPRLVALTGYGSADDIQASRAAGFDEHVVKPIDLDRLLAVLGLPASAQLR